MFHPVLLGGKVRIQAMARQAGAYKIILTSTQD